MPTSSRLLIASPEDLRAVIREVGARVGLHPGRTAEEILRGAIPSEKDVISAVTLPDYSRRIMGKPWPDLDDKSRPENLGPMPDGQGHPLFLRRNPSPKWTRASGAAYRRCLNRTVAVTDDTSADHKRYGSCTIADLVYVRDLRWKLAATNRARADEADRLIGALREHGVETVDELPDEVVQACVILDSPHES